MKEQSHKDEMSAAIRGDFQRLRERGVAATLALRDEERPGDACVESPPVPPAPATAHPEAPAASPDEIAVLPGNGGAPPRTPGPEVVVREPAAEAMPDTPAEADDASADASPRGLLARLLGR